MKISNSNTRKEEKSRFDGDEIVRLKKAFSEDGLDEGDCGVVWGVYGDDFYEASFFRFDGTITDLIFQAHEVEEVTDIQQTRYPELIENFRNWSPPKQDNT